MITIADLENRFLKKIPSFIKRDIQKWIDTEEAQRWISKALTYKLTSEDAGELYRIGKQKSRMPRLYWLCCIYIHPLTIVATVCKKNNIYVI